MPEPLTIPFVFCTFMSAAGTMASKPDWHIMEQVCTDNIDFLNFEH
jgi:hypothetical protein